MLDAWCLCMLDGSWLMAQGSWLMARGGSWLMAEAGTGPGRPLAMSHEPWAMSHEPSSMHQGYRILWNQETLHKSGLGLIKMGFWLVWWVGIILGLTPPFFRDIWSHKTSETLFLFVIFSILARSPKKNNVLLTSPSNQFRDYFIWNRIEKLMLQHWNCSPQTLNT